MTPYEGSIAKRLKKGDSTLKTLKITFRDEDQLDHAIKTGILFESHSLSVLVEKQNHPPITYTQCLNCWRFGHIAKHCHSKRACKICSGDHDEEECRNSPKCQNCHQSHASDNWSECSKFNEYKNKRLEKLSRTHIENGT